MRYIHIHCANNVVVCIPNDTRVSGYLDRAIIRWDAASAHYRTHHEGWEILALPESFRVRCAA